MSELQIGIILLLISVAAASAAQILLKKSAQKKYDAALSEYLNPYVISGYFLMFISTILTMLALRTVPLSWSPVIESVSYPLVAVLGYFFLGEKLTLRKTAGFILILAGIRIFS